MLQQGLLRDSLLVGGFPVVLHTTVNMGLDCPVPTQTGGAVFVETFQIKKKSRVVAINTLLHPAICVKCWPSF